jgi:uncharacterized protein DUF4153
VPDPADSRIPAELVVSSLTDSARPAVAFTPIDRPRFSPPPPVSGKPPADGNGQLTSIPPLRWREIAAVLAAVVLSDLTIYRGQGFAGCAALIAGVPLLLLMGSPRSRLSWRVWLVGGMLLVLSAKLVWCGSSLLVAAGVALLVAFAMALAGQTPQVLEMIAFGALAIVGGAQGLGHYGRSLTRENSLVRLPWIEVLLPLIALLLFGGIFILANPDLVTSVSQTAESFFQNLSKCLSHFSVLEVVFWGAIAWFIVGLMRPALAGAGGQSPVLAAASDTTARPSPLFGAYRNTLVTVIVLFAAYLVFEYHTLWFRQFPQGFHYSGYAHQGAAWLTFALALATAVLSLVFRGSILRDTRLSLLRNLAWIWSAFNLLMALAIYNRLFIYIHFNGLTRMRMVGLFGITTVVIGFLWVVWKIARQRDFVWLIRRHLWTLAAALYLFALTPVDTIVVRYNVRRILAGDPAPSVQISVHPISSEGVLLLAPLANCQDATIREGVMAMLAQRQVQAETLARERSRLGWTTLQLADRVALQGLRAESRPWRKYQDLSARQEALVRFHEYAYQWY